MESNKAILNRHADDPNYLDFLNAISLHLTKSVDYSSHVLFWCVEKAEDNDIDIVLIKLLKNAFEILDGISVLLSDGCEKPTEPLFRALIEIVASLRYITQDSSEAMKKALAYQVTYKHETLNLICKYPSSNPEINRSLKNFINNELNSERYKDTNHKYLQIKSNPNSHPKWFSLYSDKLNSYLMLIRNISNHKVSNEFCFEYNLYSNMVHANGQWNQLLNF
ncbi:MAG: DUF5677 domain-containing protein, partial [Clostridia bacterium]|nr:DUF5677 domain-containing protein [Clostridia bacterium]